MPCYKSIPSATLWCDSSRDLAGWIDSSCDHANLHTKAHPHPRSTLYMHKVCVACGHLPRTNPHIVVISTQT